MKKMIAYIQDFYKWKRTLAIEKKGAECTQITSATLKNNIRA